MISRRVSPGAAGPQGGESTPALDEFRLYDADGDACVTREEFCALLSSLGSPMSIEQRMAAFDELDRDKDGRVSDLEYLRWHRA